MLSPSKAGPVAAVAALMLLAAGCSPSGERALVEGDRLLRDGRTPEAVRMLERAVETLPRSAPALNHLGLAYQSAGRLDEARRAYLRALELDRSLVEAHHNLALVHEARSDWLEAERSLRTYLAARPEDGVAWARLGSVQFHAGRLDDAERSLATAKRFEAAGVEEWNTLGMISVQKRRFREARDRFLWARRLSQDNSAVLLNLAILHHQHLGDPAAAIGFYRAWLAVNPGRPEAPGVSGIVRQLEARLGGNLPPRTESTNSITRPTLGLTNSPAPRTNPPQTLPRTNPPAAPLQRPTVPRPTAANPPTATNLVATAPTAPTPQPTATPPPAVAASTPDRPATVATTPTETKPVVPPPTPLEVVQVKDDAPLVAAKDAPPEVKVPSAAEATVTSPAPSQANAAPTEPSGAGPTDFTVVAEPVTKRSVWQKMNPVGWGNPVKWFRRGSDSKPESPDTPSVTVDAPVLAAKSSDSAKPEAPAVPKSEPRRVAATPIPPAPAPRLERPAPPRYVPRAMRPLQTGNASEANREFQAAAEAQRRRDLVSAAAGYRRATAADPTHFASHFNLALVALDQGDLPLSLLASEHALQLKPDDLETRRNFAVALKQAGHTADAAEQLEEILTARPADPALHLAAAALYAGELDDVRRARRHYEAVLAIEPAHPQGPAIRAWLASNPTR
jgi:tetratricopeptide (TPR) repeat protein